MNSSIERLAWLEGRAEEQGRMVDVIRDGMANLAARMDGLDARMIALEERIDRRFEQVDQRFAGIDERLDRISGQLSNLLIGVAVAAAGGLLGVVTAIVR